MATRELTRQPVDHLSARTKPSTFAQSTNLGPVQDVLEVGDELQAALVMAQKFLKRRIFPAKELARGEDLESPVFEQLAKDHLIFS